MSLLSTPTGTRLGQSPGRENFLPQPISEINEQLVQWLKGLASWTHTFTVTCKRHNICHLPITEDILVHTARHLIRRVDLRCHGRRARRNRLIPVVVSFGWGLYDDHPHLHFCFASPAEMSFDAFASILDKEASKTFWIDRQRCIKRYEDAGWLEYLVEHGTTNLIVPLITPSSFSSSK
jgi:hypothetical protein